MPKESSYIKFKGRSYPFSYSTALYCIKRLLLRKEHSTLTCKDEIKAVHVLLFFMKLYTNFSPSPSYLSAQGISGLIQIPFTPTLDTIPEDLLNAFNNAFDNTNVKSGDTMATEEIKILIEKMNVHKALFEKEADAVENAKLIYEELLKYASGSAEESKIISSEPAPIPDKKLPLYIGINFDTPRDDILKIALQGCEEFAKSAKIDPKSDLIDLANFLENGKGSEWKTPNSHHITALFIGGNSAMAETKIYKDFKENEKQEVKLGAIVIIPRKLVFGICFTKVSIANKIPHVTLLLNHCPPKLSNNFGEALFIGVPELKSKYETGYFEKNGEEFIGKYDIKVEGKNYNAYVYKPKECMILYGKTKKFY